MKNRKKQDPDNKRLWPRVVAFVVALVVAVGGITLGVLNIGRKDAGYHDVDTEVNEELRMYNQGITFSYYFDGSSSDVKVAMRELSAFYSPQLLRVYKLLDAETEYEDFPNIAALNAHIGEDVTVGPELFRVLSDAKEKTLEQKGYNMFDGAFYRAWQDIRYLSEPQDFDPLRDTEQRERLDRLCEAGSDLSNFDLVIVDAERYVVRLEVSEDYLALLKELEQEGPILDLGLLHDAYELQLLAESLESAGYQKGYLSMSSGAVVLLSRNPAGELFLYGVTEEGVAQAAAAPAAGGRAVSFMRCFAEREGEAGYYELDGQLRHPWIPASGEYRNVIQAAVSIADDPADACYENLKLQEAPTAEALRRAVLASPAEIAYILNDGDPTVYVSGDVFTVCEDYGWIAKKLR